MGPKNPVLRYAFWAAAAKLRLEKKKVTVSSLASEMGAKFASVQTFLYRDKALAEEIGVELEHNVNGLGAYA